MQLCTLTAIVVLLSSVLDDRSLHLQRKSEEPRRAVWQRARPRRRERQPIFGLLFYYIGLFALYILFDFSPAGLFVVSFSPSFKKKHFEMAFY